MAEDYERANAREWDSSHEANENLYDEGSSQPSGALSSGWEVVLKKRKPKQPTQSTPKQHVSPPKKHAPAAYQRVPPPKWKSARGQNIETTRKRVAPKLILDIDNEAQQLWRKRMPPQDTVQIPDELALQDHAHEDLAEQHGAFIFSEHSKGLNGTRTFGLWGEEQAVSATKRAIVAWITEWSSVSGSNSGRAARFAKIYSLTPELRKRAENKWKRDVKRQKFRQHPSPGTEFEAIGSFHWPTQQYNPEEVLGASYEALDPIRMDCECYVVFDKDRSVFQVSGKVKAVQLGLLRLRGAYLQIVAPGIDHRRVYLLQKPVASNLPSDVILKTYDHPQIISNEAAVKTTSSIPTGKGVMNAPSKPQAETDSNGYRVGSLLMQTLKKLHNYAGDIRMRIRLGTFLATQYRTPQNGVYELEEYQDMIKETAFIGEVTQELGDRAVENVAITFLQTATDFLQPADTITDRLEDVIPIYSVTFTFEGNAGDLCLTMSWIETQDRGAKSSSFEETEKRWTRLERNGDKDGAAPILDISLCNLNEGMAWQFEIDASHVPDETRLSKALVDFSYTVKIIPEAARNPRSGQPFVSYKPYGVKLKTMQQRWSYRYDIRTPDGFVTDYTLELTRFQNREFPRDKAPLHSSVTPTVYEQRWRLSVFRTQWATMFTRNANLKIGEAADWDDGVETWFPTDFSDTAGMESKGDGVAQLMEKLERIQGVVENMQEDDLMEGMTVG